MTLDPQLLSSFTLLATAFAGAFLAALWLSLIFWTFRDIRRRSRDLLLRTLAVVVVALLFLPGLVIYLILRPQLTQDEDYQQSLEEEALLQSIEEPLLCPGCSRKVQEDWIVCPNCYTRLKKACHACGKLMDLPWNLCPYCATPVPGARLENISLNEALQGLPDEPEELPEAPQSENI